MTFLKLKKSVYFSSGITLLVSTVYAEKQPNVILINLDDVGATDFGYAGSDFYQTPNIDKLASEGMVFTNAYAAAANCAPSRACLLTGQMGPRHGVYTVLSSSRGKASQRKIVPIKNTLHISNDNTTLGNLMQSAGYKTITLGKWHVTKDPLKNGFDFNVGGDQRGGPYSGKYMSPFNYPNCRVDEKGINLTDYLTDRLFKFIESNLKKPFFAYLPYFAAHLPFEPKPELLEKYKSLPKGKNHSHVAYAATIEAVDQNIGRLQQFLKKNGLEKNTVIIFTSDNGGIFGVTSQTPLRSGKGSYFEGGIREPLIIKWPGKIKPGSVCKTAVSQLDFFPTLTKIAKAPNDQKPLDGVDLSPLFSGKKIEDRSLYWHFPIYLQAYNKGGVGDDTRDSYFRTRPGSVVLKGAWKLHENFEDGSIELYNLESDLGERNNLVKVNPEKATELFNDLKAWQKRVNAPIPTELEPAYGKEEIKSKKNKRKKNRTK
ncbi:MAG: sulfatase [Lentisphaeria bacterium]|nr:sulfatase [Lentisphaeria bacterium]